MSGPSGGVGREGVRGVRREVVVVGTAAVGAVPVTLALRSAHLDDAPVLLVLSTALAALAVAAMAVQPWLTALRPRGPRRRDHVVLGTLVTGLVLAHAAALFLLEPDDARFAMSPDGPTRSRMALLATVLLVVVALLGALRRRLGWSGPTWRLVHGVLAALAVGLGVGHAVLTDGALDGAGTVVLVWLGLVGVAGAATQVVAGLRRARRRDPVDARR